MSGESPPPPAVACEACGSPFPDPDPCYRVCEVCGYVWFCAPEEIIDPPVSFTATLEGVVVALVPEGFEVGDERGRRTRVLTMTDGRRLALSEGDWVSVSGGFDGDDFLLAWMSAGRGDAARDVPDAPRAGAEGL